MIMTMIMPVAGICCYIIPGLQWIGEQLGPGTQAGHSKCSIFSAEDTVALFKCDLYESRR